MKDVLKVALQFTTFIAFMFSLGATLVYAGIWFAHFATIYLPFP
jgi:hypothetical protein